jgi:hypothetical protein
MDQSGFQRVGELFAIPGRGGGGGFAALNFLQNLGFGSSTAALFGGGGPAQVPPGDYLVSITVGGRTLKQKLRVERGPLGGLGPSSP